MAFPRIRALGDAAVLVEFEPVIDARVNARVLAWADALRLRLPGVLDVVPAYASVAVHVDPRACDVVALAEQVRALDEPAIPAARDPGPEIVVAVSYGGAAGPDLASVAAWAGLTEAEVVARHTARTYRVFMTGFLPGFPYMGTVDPAIAMPRHHAPRPRVPAGSVGIAGKQTGIYPIDTPGGWRVIGWAECLLFDPGRDRPALLAPGHRVRFVCGDLHRAPASGGSR